MLNGFDWLRRSQTGSELIATLRCLADEPPRPIDGTGALGPPFSALDGPCQRCWVYPRASGGAKYRPYCAFCEAVLAGARRQGAESRACAVIWGCVSELPEQLRTGESSLKHVLYSYVHDEHRFLLVVRRRRLEPWLRELVLYGASGLRGLIQIFPTTGAVRTLSMGESLCRAAHHEANFPMDLLRVRFYPEPQALMRPHIRDRQGVLTFEVGEFLSLLERAVVFRATLRPPEQTALHELLSITDPTEEQFYWGRVLGQLSKKGRDMLNAWRLRQWPKERIKLLYELIDYVALPPTR